MYVIRDKSGSIVYLNKEKTAFILCENEAAAESAIKSLKKLLGTECVSDKVDSARSTGFWFLRRQDGTKVGEEIGARIALPSREAAEAFSESIRLKTSNLMTPMQA